jgi:hypothetical protein
LNLKYAGKDYQCNKTIVAVAYKNAKQSLEYACQKRVIEKVKQDGLALE